MASCSSSVLLDPVHTTPAYSSIQRELVSTPQCTDPQALLLFPLGQVFDKTQVRVVHESVPAFPHLFPVVSDGVGESVAEGYNFPISQKWSAVSLSRSPSHQPSWRHGKTELNSTVVGVPSESLSY